MAVIEIAKILVRRGQEQQTGIPQLDAGEFGWAQDTEHLYIGKRIIEGAVDDTNTRILTENDLNFFLLLAQNTGTGNAYYRYRDDISANLIHTTSTSIQTKLDTLVSLTDFGCTPLTNTVTDITNILRDAVKDLFANETVTWYSNEQRDFRRQLLIPAGRFFVSGVVELPPYATLIGAGPELTTITLDSETESIFKTVDAEGNTFETEDMRSGVRRAREILIKGMTLQFSNSLTTATSLISLDNVLNAKVENCILKTEINSTSTTTYGLVTHGIGINVRGTGDLGAELCENVEINECQFDSLVTAVKGTGTVLRMVISRNNFSNLDQGIVLQSEDTLHGPINGVIAYNKFQDIVRQGIYVGKNPNGRKSDHLSTQNYFARVGNGVLNEYTNTEAYAVISFMEDGNKTVDDYFARRAYANTTTDGSFYYNHFVEGYATVADSQVNSATVTSSTTITVMRIPLNDGNQVGFVNYQLYSGSLSRKGNIIFNVTPNGYVALTDTFNYVESLAEVQDNIYATSGSGVNKLVVTASNYSFFDTIIPNDGIWYLTGNPTYSGKAAIITSITSSSGFYTIVTDSNDPIFDFSTAGEKFALLKSETTDVSFNYATNVSQNFSSLSVINSGVTDAHIEYQVNLQI